MLIEMWFRGEARNRDRAVRVEWRAPTKGSRNLLAAMRIVTSDGRHITGSHRNYARILIDRADSPCSNGGDTTVQAELQEFQTLIHP